MTAITSAGWSGPPMPTGTHLRRSSPRPWSARLARIAGYVPIVWAAFLPEAGQAETLGMAAFADLARRCGASVAPFTLAAVAKTESGFRTLMVSDNRTRKVRNFETITAATVVAEQLIDQGHSVDLGLMQINSANLRRLGYTARDALDACKSISGGALILGQNYLRSRNALTPQIALRHALSLYNTGNPRNGFRNGYVRRVEQAARGLAPWVARAGGVALASLARPAAIAAGPAVGEPATVDWWDVWGGIAPAGAMRSGNVLIF